MEFISKSEKETQKLGEILAKEIKRSPSRRRGAVVVGLEGELGAGKTVFVKGFIRGLGIKNKISSPTFVLMKVYNLPAVNHEGFRFVFHLDGYRLKDDHDLLALGVKEIFAEPRNLVLLEWSERFKKILPDRYLKVHIDHLNKKMRKITVRK